MRMNRCNRSSEAYAHPLESLPSPHRTSSCERSMECWVVDDHTSGPHEAATMRPVAPGSPGVDEVAPSAREVGYEYSLNLAPLLEHLGVTLLVSTYQAGKLVLVS